MVGNKYRIKQYIRSVGFAEDKRRDANNEEQNNHKQCSDQTEQYSQHDNRMAIQCDVGHGRDLHTDQYPKSAQELGPIVDIVFVDFRIQLVAILQ